METNKHSQHDSIQEHVLAKIRAGEVRMRPRLYFVAKLIILAVVAVCTLIVTAFVLSFIIFSVRVSGRAMLLNFGFHGLLIFITLFPWVTLIIDILLLILLEQLIKHFKFGYRWPLRYLVAGSGAMVIIAAVIINFTPLHMMLLERAEHNHLPIVGHAYEHLRRPPPRERGLFRGSITDIQGNVVTIAFDREGTTTTATTTITIPEQIPVEGLLHVGDKVFVAGNIVNGQIQAFGIRKIMDESMFMPHDTDELR